MARREELGRNIEQSTIQRVIAGIRAAQSVWFGPQQPMLPVAQDENLGAIGRKYDYPVGVNLNTQPRQAEPITFGQLRGLADGYDLLRLVIETRKDQIEGFEWEIISDKKSDKDVIEASKFFERPTPEYDWATWLRASLEDIFVLDAWAIYPRMTKGGKLYSLDLVDGATIKLVIDETGRTPTAPQPAYQQVLKGVAATNYSTDDLLYFMRNPRTNRMYGYSPVEQILTTVNIAIRRQIHQLQYYTEGNIPDALVGVDPSWSATQVSEFQVYFDSVMSGNTSARRKMTFVPGDASKIQFTKDQNLKDEYDEWLARVVCYAFSLPPTAFVKQQNKATAEQAADSAKEEGLVPLLGFVKKKIDFILRHVMDLPGLTFNWKISNTLDPIKQAQLDEIYLRNGITSIDEVRLRNGDTALGVGHLLWTGAGPVSATDFTTEKLEAASQAASQSTE